MSQNDAISIKNFMYSSRFFYYQYLARHKYWGPLSYETLRARRKLSTASLAALLTAEVFEELDVGLRAYLLPRGVTVVRYEALATTSTQQILSSVTGTNFNLADKPIVNEEYKSFFERIDCAAVSARLARAREAFSYDTSPE